MFFYTSGRAWVVFISANFSCLKSAISSQFAVRRHLLRAPSPTLMRLI